MQLPQNKSGKLERGGKTAGTIASSKNSQLLYLVDKNSRCRFLVDTGAAISVVPPRPEDEKHRTLVSLKAAYNSSIATFGERLLNLDINTGRELPWTFVVAAVKEPILGIDFITNFQLNINSARGEIFDEKSGRSIKVDKRQASSSNRISSNLVEGAAYAELLARYPTLTSPRRIDAPCKHSVKHYIPTTGKPVYCRPRRLHPEAQKAAEEAFMKLLDEGIIEPSSSAWCSPLHLVPKKDSSWRPVGDYRALNLKTERDTYPLPFLQNFAANLHKKTVFSKVDLRDAYLQVPVAEGDVEKTTITTPFGAYQFRYMPFGLASASQTFQRFMHTVLRKLESRSPHDGSVREVTIFSYVDDLLVASDDEASHLLDLEALFLRLSEYGLRISPHKCEFGKSSLDFLGHHISAAGIAPLASKVSAIQDFSLPTHAKGLRRYLGILNFYRRFLKGAAEIVAPLYDLCGESNKRSKSTPLTWTKQTTSAFQRSKKCLADAALLTYPVSGAPVSIATDASDSAVGAVLQQLVDGAWRPLGFFSRRLDKKQLAWSVFQKELLAVFLGVRHFLYYLGGVDFTILTDHAALIGAARSGKERESAVETRQLRFISQYTSKWEHVKGSENITADALSRSLSPHAPEFFPTTRENNGSHDGAQTISAAEISSSSSHQLMDNEATASGESTPTEVKSGCEINALITDLLHVDQHQLRDLQMQDPELQTLLTRSETEAGLKLTKVKDLYCSVVHGKARPFVPAPLRRKLFELSHTVAHPGIRASIRELNRRFVWPGMKKQINDWVRSCDACQVAKITRHNVAPTVMLPPPSDKFACVNLDIVGPLPACKGYSHILTAIDRWSRWTEMIPISDTSAETVADAFVSN